MGYRYRLFCSLLHPFLVVYKVTGFSSKCDCLLCWTWFHVYTNHNYHYTFQQLHVHLISWQLNVSQSVVVWERYQFFKFTRRRILRWLGSNSLDSTEHEVVVTYFSCHIATFCIIIIIIIIIFKLRTAAFKAYCVIWVRCSNFRYQASPHVSPRESTQRRKVELWARNVRKFCLNAEFHVTF